jgi:hypothetical protein
MWRLRIWQHPTIGRVLARATRPAPTSVAELNSAPAADLDAACNEALARERGLSPTSLADGTRRDGPFWRRREQEVRAVAAEISDPQSRQRMLLIAYCYKFLADRADIWKSHKHVIRGSRQHIVESSLHDASMGQDERPGP